MKNDFSERLLNYTHKLMRVVQSMPPVRLGGIEITVEAMLNTYDEKHADTGLHEHTFYELSLMSQGSMNYQVGNASRTIKTDTHDMIFIPPRTIHRRVALGIPSIITGFQIQINSINAKYDHFVRNLPLELKKMGYGVSGAEPVTNIIEKIFSEVESEKPFFKDRVSLLINDFFITFFREHFFDRMKHLEKSSTTRDFSHTFQANLITMACRYVEEHLARQIQIDEVASYCGISKRHLNRIFSAHKGISPGNYIIKLKIKEAQRRLLHNDRLIKEVAYELGFSNVSYFCRLFKKITGQTPQSYQQRIRQGQQ